MSFSFLEVFLLDLMLKLNVEKTVTNSKRLGRVINKSFDRLNTKRLMKNLSKMFGRIIIDVFIIKLFELSAGNQ